MDSQTRQKISNSLKGRMPKFIPDNRGVKRSPEQRERLRTLRLGKTGNKKYSKDVRHCIICSKPIPQTRLNGKHVMPSVYKLRTLCSNDCRKVLLADTIKRTNIDTRGEANPRWIKDRTKLKVSREKSYDSRYKFWMRHVKNRDGWKCKISNGDCSGRLEAHHILSWRDYPELRYEINNGITLCHFHHPRKKDDEIKLASYLTGLLASNSN